MPPRLIVKHDLDLLQRSRGKGGLIASHWHTLIAKHIGAGDICGTAEQIQGDKFRSAAFGLLQNTAFCPLIERSHGRAAPHLEIHTPILATPDAPLFSDRIGRIVLPQA